MSAEVVPFPGSVLLFSGVVPSPPRGKGSARGQPGGRKARRSYTDPATDAYMKRATKVLAAQFRGRDPIAEPVKVTLLVVCERPETLVPKFTGRERAEQPPIGRFGCPKKPDNDNVEKMLFDCLVKAGVLLDDRMITNNETAKVYVEVGGDPGVVVEVRATGDRWAAFALGADRPSALDGGAEVGDDGGDE